MSEDVITVAEVAEYLKLNERTVYRLAQEGKVPAAKIAGQWRFRRDMLDEWMANQMRQFATPAEPASAGLDGRGDYSLADLVQPEAIDVDLAAASREAVLKQLVDLAERTGRVKMPQVLVRLLREREQLCSTAIEAGLALPHPRHMLSGVVDEPVMSIGRSADGVDFGAPDGQRTRLFFMVCSPNDRTHLHLLARLSRLLAEPRFKDALLRAATPAHVVDAFARAAR